MWSWAFTFLVIAVVAAIFAFGGFITAAVGISKVLFFIFVVLFLVALAAALLTQHPRSY